jgi:hypothetical protein
VTPHFNREGSLWKENHTFEAGHSSPWSTALLEKLTVPQLVKKFPTFHRNQKLIAVFKTASQLSVPQARLIQSKPVPIQKSSKYNLKIQFLPDSNTTNLQYSEQACHVSREIIDPYSENHMN